MPGTVGRTLLPIDVIHVYYCYIKIYNSFIFYNSAILFAYVSHVKSIVVALQLVNCTIRNKNVPFTFITYGVIPGLK